MRKIPLNGRAMGTFALVSQRAFASVKDTKWYLANNGYVTTSRGRYLHRVITDASENQEVDHINFDRLDCRDENLRLVSKAENRMHNRQRSHSTQPYKGVRARKKGTFAARIRFGGKEYYLGTFATAEAAATSYDNAAVSLHGKMAHLNLPERTDQ